MKFYYLVDENGNEIGLCNSESQIYDTNGLSLDKKLKTIKTETILTQAEYDALSVEEQQTGLYYITDSVEPVTVAMLNEKVNMLEPSVTTIANNMANGRVQFTINEDGELEYTVVQ